MIEVVVLPIECKERGLKRPLIIPFHSSRDVPEFTVKQAIQASGLSKEKFLKLL